MQRDAKRVMRLRPFIRSLLLVSLLSLVSSIAGAQSARLDPATPRWGDSLAIVYDTSRSESKFTPADDVYVVLKLEFPSSARFVSGRMILNGTQFRHDFPVMRGLSALTAHFITLAGGWDEQAILSAMIYESEGRLARGAAQSRLRTGRYQELFSRELALYPDNYAAYVPKWEMVIADRFDQAGGVIQRDLRKLLGERNETPALLYAVGYGHLLLGVEPKARECLQKLFERFPEDAHTFLALRDYQTELINRGSPAETTREVARIRMALIERAPQSELARGSLAQLAADPNTPLELVERIARGWMRDDATHPSPHLHLAEAYWRQYREYEQAEGPAQKAIELLLAGQWRLRGDLNGKQTQQLLGRAYLISSDLAFRRQRYNQALATIKIAETLPQDPPFAAHLLEAKIWRAMENWEQAEVAYLESFRRGSREAEDRLKSRYQEKNQTLAGFDDYLLKAGGAGKSSPTSQLEHRPAPPFRMTTLDGRTYTLDQLLGKIVVINLWFIACGPCRKEIPKLNQMVAELKDREVVFLAPTPDQAESLREFLKTTDFAYQIVPQAEDVIAGTFQASLFPTHLVIDRQGLIVAHLVGASERRPEEVRRIVLQLLNQ